MFRQRIIISLLLLPPGIISIALGGFWYFALLSIFFLTAAYEYGQMMTLTGSRPARWLIVASVLLLLFMRSAPTFIPAWQPHAQLLSGGALLLVFVSITAWHVIDFERGATTSGTDWAISLAGALYIGWLGSYFAQLRALPDGLWWTMIALPAVWLSDSGAYAVGRRFGKRLLAPRLSPKKTWEGFFGGVMWGIVFGAFFGWVWRFGASPNSAVGASSGAIIGLVVALFGTLGDLGISMLKRQVGVKDTGSILGAHGGLLDRVDSWLIAGPIAFYVILLFFG